MQLVGIMKQQAMALFDDGSAVKFSNMFDIDGDETSDPDKAVAAVVQRPDGLWLDLDLREFETVTKH